MWQGKPYLQDSVPVLPLLFFPQSQGGDRGQGEEGGLRMRTHFHNVNILSKIRGGGSNPSTNASRISTGLQKLNKTLWG